MNSPTITGTEGTKARECLLCETPLEPHAPRASCRLCHSRRTLTLSTCRVRVESDVARHWVCVCTLVCARLCVVAAVVWVSSAGSYSFCGRGLRVLTLSDPGRLSAWAAFLLAQTDTWAGRSARWRKEEKTATLRTQTCSVNVHCCVRVLRVRHRCT